MVVDSMEIVRSVYCRFWDAIYNVMVVSEWLGPDLIEVENAANFVLRNKNNKVNHASCWIGEEWSDNETGSFLFALGYLIAERRYLVTSHRLSSLDLCDYALVNLYDCHDALVNTLCESLAISEEDQRLGGDYVLADYIANLSDSLISSKHRLVFMKVPDLTRHFNDLLELADLEYFHLDEDC